MAGAKVYLFINHDEDLEFQDRFTKEDCRKNYPLVPAGVLDKIKEGDLLDFDGYRGIGLYYYNGEEFIKTLGEYGYFLPSDAWKMVHLHGLRFFISGGAEMILLPKDVKVETEDDRHLSLNQDQLAIYIDSNNFDNEYVTVDGVKYKTDILNLY